MDARLKEIIYVELRKETSQRMLVKLGGQFMDSIMRLTPVVKRAYLRLHSFLKSLSSVRQTTIQHCIVEEKQAFAITIENVDDVSISGDIKTFLDLRSYFQTFFKVWQDTDRIFMSLGFSFPDEGDKVRVHNAPRIQRMLGLDGIFVKQGSLLFHLEWIQLVMRLTQISAALKSFSI